MKSLPTLGDYENAIRNRHARFKSSRIKESQPVPRKGKKNGEIECGSGNYAIVFKLAHPSGKMYAVRCFTRIVEGQQQRYQAINAHLKSRKPQLSMFVDFDFLPHEVEAGTPTGYYHVVFMEYVEHTPFLTFIQSILAARKPEQLGDLAQQWQHILAQLEEAQIAHGDLQHGNIIIDKQHAIRLVDYDGMYVPQLHGNMPDESGLPEYQHPERKHGYYDTNADAFSALVIYTSLRALQADPKLWGLYPGDDSLFFQAEDFVQPGQTPTWDLLARSPDQDVVKLAARLEEFCRQPIASLPHLSQVLAELPSYTPRSPRVSAPAPTQPPNPPARGRHPWPAPTQVRRSRPPRWGRLVLSAFGLIGVFLLLRAFGPGSAAIPNPAAGNRSGSSAESGASALALIARPATEPRPSAVPEDRAAPVLATAQPTASLPTLASFGSLTAIGVTRADDGSEQFQLCEIAFTDASLPDPPQVRCDVGLPTGTRDLAWSGDGSQLLFSAPPVNGGVSQLQIFVMTPANGVVPQALTEPTESARRPRWRPSTSGEFAFEAQNQAGVFEVQAMQLDRSNRRVLITTTAASIWPAWSPDGRSLLFSNDAQHGYQLYRIDATLLPPNGLRSISGATRLSQQTVQATCSNGMITATNDLAYLCEVAGSSYLIAGTQRLDIPATIHPHGYLAWLPNNSGYLFECGVDNSGRDRSRLCLADLQHHSVAALALDETRDYYAPSFRPLPQTR